MWWPGVIIAVAIVYGMYCWGRVSTQCAAEHRDHGRCQLRPSHWPNLHSGRDGGKWR